jgi:hypothetical protein
MTKLGAYGLCSTFDLLQPRAGLLLVVYGDKLGRFLLHFVCDMTNVVRNRRRFYGPSAYFVGDMTKLVLQGVGRLTVV